MRLPITLSLYIIRHFLMQFLIAFMTFATIIMLIDILELLRRSADKDVSFGTIIYMAMLKFPNMGQKVLPFIMLVGAVLSYTKLTRHQELSVIRSAGVSVWQFLMPTILTAFLMGLLVIIVINPISTSMLAKYERVESRELETKTSFLALSNSRIWLRQKNFSQSKGSKWGEIIVHSRSFDGVDDIELREVIIFIFSKDGEFLQRIDAKSGKLLNGFWHLKNVIITSSNSLSEKHDEHFLETDLTSKDVKNSFASPKTISFWELPDFIDTLQKSGFSAIEHRLHWHKILSSPIFFASMILIAAIFSLRPTRQGRTGLLITSSIMTGFFIYFLSDLISSFGLSGSMPVAFAAWAPTFVVMLTGIGLLLHFEDG